MPLTMGDDRRWLWTLFKEWLRLRLLMKSKLYATWEHYQDGRVELVGVFSTRERAEAAVPLSSELLDAVHPKRYHYYVEEITLDRRGS